MAHWMKSDHASRAGQILEAAVKVIIRRRWPTRRRPSTPLRWARRAGRSRRAGRAWGQHALPTRVVWGRKPRVLRGGIGADPLQPVRLSGVRLPRPAQPQTGTRARSSSHTPSHEPTTQKGSQRGCKHLCKKDFPLVMTAAPAPERTRHHCILQDVCSLTDPLY